MRCPNCEVKLPPLVTICTCGHTFPEVLAKTAKQSTSDFRSTLVLAVLLVSAAVLVLFWVDLTDWMFYVAIIPVYVISVPWLFYRVRTHQCSKCGSWTTRGTGQRKYGGRVGGSMSHMVDVEYKCEKCGHSRWDSISTKIK